MIRPPECRIASTVPCPQCTKPINTLYQCEHEGQWNTEVMELRCTCGYSYVARGRFGEKP